MLGLTDFKYNTNIKNIQRGITYLSSSERYANVSISPVNLQKTELEFLGNFNFASSSREPGIIYMLDSSTIQIYRAYVSSTIKLYVSWQLIEWE